MVSIPNNPKIRIENFLPYIDGNIKVISKIGCLKKLHKSTGLSYASVSKRLGLSESFYRVCMQGKKYPSIKFLKLLLDIDKNILHKYYNNTLRYTARTKIVNLPKFLTPRLAYLLGYLQGDGFIGSDKKTYAFSDEHTKHLQYMNRLNEQLFGNLGYLRIKKSRISKNGSPCLEIRQYAVNSYLHHVFSIPRGIKNNLAVPNKIYEHKEIMRWYLRGLFDADGTLPRDPKKVKQPFIDLDLKDKSFLEEIKKILYLYFGVVTLDLYPKTSKSPNSDRICLTWELRIRKKQDILKFLEEISFHHFDKNRRVGELLKSFKNT